MPQAFGGTKIVDTAQISDSVIKTADIADAQITTPKIAADAIDATKIPTGAVGSDEIGDGAIVNADINAAAAIADSKLAQITSGGKVSGSALWDLQNIPSGAGAIPSTNLPAFSTTVKVGTTTYDLSTASGTQNIAHGLGATPSYVKLTCMKTSKGSATADVNGWAIKTATQSAYMTIDYINGAMRINNGTFRFYGGINESEYQTGVVTADATNIIITWTKTSNPDGTLNIMWEAFA